MRNGNPCKTPHFDVIKLLNILVSSQEYHTHALVNPIIHQAEGPLLFTWLNDLNIIFLADD